MKNLALILAGGKGTRLDILSSQRAKPAVPFGGKFKLIDFTLSNCVNSGIYNVGVLTQYLPRPLHEHIGIGIPWDLDRQMGGIDILSPAPGKEKEGNWYQGTAHAVQQNINYIKQNNPKHVIILPGDHVYKMDYSEMIKYHEKNNAELTIAAQYVNNKETKRFGILNTTNNMEITSFVEKPDNPSSNLASMGIYVFNTETLIEYLEKYCNRKKHDFAHHIIPEIIKNKKVYAYEFDGYWKDVGTIKCFWKTNLALTKPYPELNLYDKDWKIHTRDKEKPPVKFGSNGKAVKSIVSNGAIINGEVRNSVIGPEVIIEEGTIVKNSVIFSNTVIKRNSIVSKTVIDSGVIIEKNSHIGTSNDLTPNRKVPQLLNNGLTIIGKETTVPAKIKIGRNCRIYPYLDENDFNTDKIPSGNTITAKQEHKPYFLDVAK